MRIGIGNGIQRENSVLRVIQEIYTGVSGGLQTGAEGARGTVGCASQIGWRIFICYFPGCEERWFIV
jgi:hypothetical protein